MLNASLQRLQPLLLRANDWLADRVHSLKLKLHLPPTQRQRAVATMNPARAAVHEPESPSQRIAERAAEIIGSWRFLMIQAAGLALWVIVNALHVAGFDPPPFILLNLMLSFQAAFTAPMLLMAANTEARRDRKRDDIEAAEVEELTQMNQQQLLILAQQNEILALLKAHTVDDAPAGNGAIRDE